MNELGKNLFRRDYSTISINLSYLIRSDRYLIRSDRFRISQFNFIIVLINIIEHNRFL